VIYDERINPQTGRLHLNQKRFRNEKEVLCQINVDQKEKGTPSIPFNLYAKIWSYREATKDIESYLAQQKQSYF
jgi:hypothetical protein